MRKIQREMEEQRRKKEAEEAEARRLEEERKLKAEMEVKRKQEEEKRRRQDEQEKKKIASMQEDLDRANARFVKHLSQFIRSKLKFVILDLLNSVNRSEEIMRLP